VPPKRSNNINEGKKVNIETVFLANKTDKKQTEWQAKQSVSPPFTVSLF